MDRQFAGENQFSGGKPVPGILQAIVFLIAMLVSLVLAGVVIGFIDDALSLDFADNPWTLGLVNLVVMSAFAFLGLRLAGAPARAVFPLKRPGVSLYFLITIATVGLAILISEADNLTRYFYPPPPELEEEIFGFLRDPELFWGAFFVIVVVAPLTEEFIFRGLILRGFMSRYSFRKAVFVSAAFFTLFHLYPWQFLGAFVYGIFFAWMAVRTRSLVPGIYAHVLNNALFFVFNAIDTEASPYAGVVEGVHFQPLWLDAAGVACAVWGTWMLAGRLKGAEFIITADDEPLPGAEEGAK